MEAAEPLVERNHLGPVVDREPAVVQVMEIRVSLQTLLVFRDELVEAGMPECRAHARVHEVEYRVEGI